MTEEAEKSPPTRKPNLARWFWGGIIVMAALSFLLSVAAMLRQHGTISESELSTSFEDGPGAGEGTEASASELENLLTPAKEAALKAVNEQIGPLLDAAYQPVYATIPHYADYHYSVWGEYASLGGALLGNVEDKLQEVLFSGLGTRLGKVSADLDIIFNTAFATELETRAATTNPTNINLGPLTRMAIDGTVSRMQVTAPVGTAAAIGTGAAIKAAATAMAQKVAAKLAIKAAAKTGGKWVAAAAGAGTGAVLCSWSGPGAGLCAAAGGVGAWIVADYGIVKLDEYWNRDEFEADLETMIDEQKEAHRQALEQALAARALAVQDVSDEIVQQHDFTLRDLYGPGNAEVCEIAADLAARYELMREHLRERRPEALQALRDAMVAHEENLSLGRMVREINDNLTAQAMQITVSGAQIKGNLPLNYRESRNISGRLYLNETSLDIVRTPASEHSGFIMNLPCRTVLSADQPLKYAIALEQHRRVLRNRYFGGSGEVDILESVADTDGLVHSIRLRPPMIHEDGVRSIDNVSMSARIGMRIDLTLELRAARLSSLKNAPDCR